MEQLAYCQLRAPRRSLRFPGARLVRFERAGHVSSLAEPEAYATAVAAFLTETDTELAKSGTKKVKKRA
jgi:pimeloyl-ACP methyl ester carboxylesterase